ncbi:GlxA family transcriptional regulator [Nonomuraea spiralis]|uniref:GlxA family transcriptional regulator n=1 Tax=Nonomuraea spiralis TaxID=46182 RepID=A0ABV5II01_9ACTN|nr:helix-turn-helix domain-containing protein [Nonomuraea spiralis]GGS98556.1 AraC family transcriptional regulator [Nonomuraea spiralis]
MPAAHRVVIVLFPDVDLLDVTGPAEVFALANRVAGRALYDVRLAGPQGGQVSTSAGVRLVADLTFEEVGDQVDTLVVPGAVTVTPTGPRALTDAEVVAWVRRTAPGARRVASVCVGAHILAEAGLLDGLTATTHWSTAAQLAADHPRVTVDPDPIFLRSSGRVWTGAGISACLDLTLALVAEDHGEEIALAVARELVVYLKRQGGQSQFSVPLAQAASGRRDIDDLRLWIAEHLAEELTTVELAARMGLSQRQFSRVFRQRTGFTPAAYVESARVEVARRLLETTDLPLPRVAADSGLGSVETLHRAFRRRLGTGPGTYRRRFHTVA